MTDTKGLSMYPITPEFEAEKRENVAALGADAQLNDMALEMMRLTGKYKYSYNFTWLGIPVIQWPQDLIALQEVIWEARPEVIIEVGIAHGGGLVFDASLLHILGGDRLVVGIDIEIRPHNRRNIEAHPLAGRIRLIEGSSVDPATAVQAAGMAKGKKTLVILDSNHTHQHVLRELELYSPLVGAGSYLVVFDTSIEDQPPGHHTGKPWDKGNNPKTAVWEFLKTNDRFVIDKDIDAKLLLTVARDGYLRCVKG